MIHARTTLTELLLATGFIAAPLSWFVYGSRAFGIDILIHARTSLTTSKFGASSARVAELFALHYPEGVDNVAGRKRSATAVSESSDPLHPERMPDPTS